MEVAVAVATEVAEKGAVIVERAKLARVVLRRVIGRKVDDYFDSVCMGRGDEVVKLGPGITRIAEVFFNAFEIAGLVAVV